LVSNIFETTDSKNLDEVKVETFKSQNWRNGDQTSYINDLKKTEVTLNQAN